MRPELRSRLASAALLAIVVAVTLVLVTPFCGVLHRCGCTALWSGGESRCNYENKTGPHCPWCEHRALGGVVVVCMVGAEAATFWLLRRRGRGRVAATLGAFAAGHLAGVAVGALAWGFTDYPHYLVLDARTRMGLPPGPIPTYANGDGGAPCCSSTNR